MTRFRISFLTPLVVLVFALSSCSSMSQTTRDNPKAVLGSLGGAALGGGIAALAGGDAGWIVAGAALGGIAGGAIGHHLDERDKRMAAEAAARSFEQSRTGVATTWQNPDSGNSGSITPTRTYQTSSGQYCREYQQTISVGGEEQQGHGTACRQPDGTWKIQG